MLDVLRGLRRAAEHEDPAAGLGEARAHWRSLTDEQQHALTGLGRLLAADGGSPPLAGALGELERAAAASDPAETRAALDAVRVHWPRLDEAERRAIAPVGRLLAPPPGAGRPAATPIRTDLTPEQLLERMGLTGFRPGQREAVQAALDGRDATVVMPTGGGKSLCYQLPGIASAALTVVVSPLIALIADQHRRLLEAGQRSAMLAGPQGEQANRDALEQVRGGTAQIVFCAPERFSSRAFLDALSQREIGLFVVDEAHCVSEWGHDFRPDYLRLRPVIEALGRPPVMAATATATPRVADEIIARLGLRDPVVVRRGFDRPNLSFDVIAESGDGAVARKRAALLGGLGDPANRPAIVYCGTRKDTEALTELLTGHGLPAVAYHAGMAAEDRARSQERFMAGEVDVVCATNAFGMGVDKADIRSVWHWALPTSVEAYYQEAGRAGRDGAPARAVLLAMRADLGRLIQFIKTSELRVEDVERSLAGLRRGAVDGVTTVDPRAQDDADRIAVAVAERAGAVGVAPAGAGALAVSFTAPLDRGRAAQLCRQAADRRWDAYHALKRFAESEGVCRRRQLLDHFGDDEPTAPLGRCCDVCDPIDWLTPAPVAGTRTRSRQPAAPLPDVDPHALDQLKQWRRERADGKPAYTVATDAVLVTLLAERPADADGLLAVKGIGPAFVTKYADELLPLLAGL